LEIVKNKGSSLIFSVLGGWGKEKKERPAEARGEAPSEAANQYDVELVGIPA